MSRLPSILVLDGEQRSALAVVRSLGRRGFRVIVGSAIFRSLAGGSRFAAREEVLPDPLASTARYTGAVARVAGAEGVSAILPMTEASTLALLEERHLLPNTPLPLGDLTQFKLACDKGSVLALAEELGLAVPPQWTISGAPGSEAAVPLDGFPVVIKPVRSVVGPTGSRTKVSVRHARTPEGLSSALRELGPGAGPFLVQARIQGPGLGVFLLRWEGQVRARFAHQRIREKPPSGGVSVCCESVNLDPLLLAQSEALLKAIGWEGVAMVEYKRDSRTGRNYLMEVNPRFWGSLQLAIDAGVDFPYYLMQLALGHEIPTVDRWKTGLRSRWRLGELDHLVARLRRSKAELDLPDDAPSLVRTALATLVPWAPRQRGEVFRINDPRPAARELLAWLRAL